MLVDFLEAFDGTPLTKTFTLNNDGRIDTEPYPFVRDFNSYRENVETPSELYEVLTQRASMGQCQLKGELDRPLEAESRAGHTTATALTHWVLLDLDFDNGWDDLDHFIIDVYPEWKNVSYIWQDSSSAGVLYEPGLRGHLWFMLSEPVSPAVLKTWLRAKNLTVPGLADRLNLNANGMSLKWPLDITTCQNDKLIYIAPPVLNGIPEKIPERFRLVKKVSQKAKPPHTDLTLAAIENLTLNKISMLREAHQLPKRKPKLNSSGAVTILNNPDQCAVTGVKHGRGFVYLNLNGGNSWGYYFPSDKPDIVYNFKDEPAVYLKDIAPHFYFEYRRERTREAFGEIDAYVFRDPNADVYYNALYRKGENKMTLLAPAKSKERLADFMNQYGYAMPDPIEDWQIVFDPTCTEIVNPDTRWINRFRPTEYLIKGPHLTPYPEIPPVINKILESICVGDPATKEHFLNWLACLVQTRKQLCTAWIFHGISGTGKGIFLEQVITPILGKEQTTSWTTKNFEDNFNAQLENTCLLWLDEFRVSDAHSESVMSRLKNLITEPVLQVRAMRQNTVATENYCNVIIATNYPDPVRLVANDRRFNVAPPQEQPLKISTDEVQQLQEEVWLFTSYLMHRKADAQTARTVIKNFAREQMIEASQTTHESFFTAVREGYLEYFTNHLRMSMPYANLLEYQKYHRTVLDWARHALSSRGAEPITIDREELREIFSYLTGNASTPTKFARMCSIYRVEEVRIMERGVRYRSIRIHLKVGDMDRLHALVRQIDEDHRNLKLIHQKTRELEPLHDRTN